MSLEAEIHQRHVRFNAAITRRSALVERRSGPDVKFVLNTPYGVPKELPPIVRHFARSPDHEWWPCMWMYDLATYKPQPFANKIRIVIDVVCQHFGVTRDDISSSRRTADIVLPRQVAMHLARKTTLKSLPEIGRSFGDRDHTTVLHSDRKIADLAARDALFSSQLLALELKIRGMLA